jgi:glycosyltransferase involved in cell wall biosynthesis
MNIALVCDWFLPRVGGIERHLVQLAERLAAKGHEVTVITPMKGATMPVENVHLHRVSGSLFPGAGLLWRPADLRQLAKLFVTGQFDLVHVHASIVSPTAFAAVYYAQKQGVPVVCTLHSMLGGLRGVFRLLDRLARWTTWPVIYSGVSNRVAEELTPFVTRRPVFVLPNAVDPNDWRLLHVPPRDTIAIACVMRLARRKRGAALLRAVHRLRRATAAKIVLHLAGDGSERRRLERLARRLGLGAVVRFHGVVSREQVKAILGASHFFVLPSKLEAFGIAALEARAAGLPVVAMRESGVGDFITDSEEGLLAADDEQLADCLQRLCTEPILLERITAHNREIPVAFTWDNAVELHLATYGRARRLCRSLARSIDGIDAETGVRVYRPDQAIR